MSPPSCISQRQPGATLGWVKVGGSPSPSGSRKTVLELGAPPTVPSSNPNSRLGRQSPHVQGRVMEHPLCRSKTSSVHCRFRSSGRGVYWWHGLLSRGGRCRHPKGETRSATARGGCCVYQVVYPVRRRNPPARAHAIQRDSRKLLGKCGWARTPLSMAQACQARGRGFKSRRPRHI